jgi:hypothetical protein
MVPSALRSRELPEMSENLGLPAFADTLASEASIQRKLTSKYGRGRRATPFSFPVDDKEKYRRMGMEVRSKA